MGIREAWFVPGQRFAPDPSRLLDWFVPDQGFVPGPFRSSLQRCEHSSHAVWFGADQGFVPDHSNPPAWFVPDQGFEPDPTNWPVWSELPRVRTRPYRATNIYA